MISIEFENRSGRSVDCCALVSACREVLHREGVVAGELGLHVVDSEEMRLLKHEHLGVDDVGDVLSFPLDGRAELPAGEPRALGDLVLCPLAVDDDWRAALVHGLLHLLGYEHGAAMERREAELVP
ncbi:MAG: rRNA maturation RNase YbeY [Actinomycetia bacterium]|nr:rRNA maturation RNase YbeY [Actinomycetes bacterium]